MRLALRLARRGRGRTAPNPMVGAVVVRDGRIVGEGYHRKVGGPHAEVFALEGAGPLARGADLYVTLEPCCHQGRTGPCTERITEAGIARVVVALEDPFPAVAGKGIAFLREAGVRVEVGDGEEEARVLNEAYLCRVEKGRPWVDVKMAATMDGFAADRRGRSQWITGEKARARVHRMRRGSDAILVGSGTVLADDPRLTVRSGSRVSEPIRVVLDGRLRTPPTARLIGGGDPGRVIVATRRDAPTRKRERLLAAGVVVWTLPAERGGGVRLLPLLERLAGAGVNRLLVEGGAAVAGAFVREGVADRIHLFIAPRLLGSGRSAFAGLGALAVGAPWEGRVASLRRWGGDLEIQVVPGGEACSQG